MMVEISIIIPCYNEEESIPIYYEAVSSVIRDMEVSTELIFVDDGSRDGTLRTLQQLSMQHSNCKYLTFSRNFGKEAALYAGLEHATGRYTAVMDVDLQDPPELLEQMYRIIQTGEYDCVAARRMNREGEPHLRAFLSDEFYKVINKISDTQIVNGARDFRLMTSDMRAAILEMQEYNRFSKGIFQWVGFRTKWLEYKHTERCAGETKWSLVKLIKYSIEGITGYSVAPLSFAAFVGVIFSLISIVMMIVIACRTLLLGNPTPGWTSLVCIIFLVSGIQLLCLGIVGEYLAKAYMETKKRPIYILKGGSYEVSGSKTRDKKAEFMQVSSVARSTYIG